jgi:hypothetical protein
MVATALATGVGWSGQAAAAAIQSPEGARRGGGARVRGWAGSVVRPRPEPVGLAEPGGPAGPVGQLGQQPSLTNRAFGKLV